MSETEAGVLLSPTHLRIGASADRARMALTFRSDGETPTTVVLPVAGAAALHLKITRLLEALGARAVAKPAAETVP